MNGVVTAVVGRDHAALEATVAEITAHGGRAIGVAADCTSEDDLAMAQQTVAEELGPVDILAAFAGGAGAPVASSDETGSHWRAVLDSDLTATFLTVSAFLPDMLVRRQGAVLTMSSAAARQPARSSAAYAAAKAGVIAFTRHLATEVAATGVRVNCLAPAAVENAKMRARMPAEALSALGSSFPLGRIGQPGDVAAAAVFLVSAASSWVTGVTFDVAGGKVMV